MIKDNIVFNIILTAVAPIVWGSTYLVTTEFLPPNSPLLASVLRALPAGILLLLIGRQLPTGQWWWKACVLGILNIGAFFYFLFLAAYHLPGGVAALIMSVQPVIVLLLGIILLGQSIQTTQTLACALGMFGVALIALQPTAELDFIGVTAGLAGALSMATGLVLTKRWGRPKDVGVLTFTGWQLIFGGLVLIPPAFFSEGLPEAITLTNWLGFTYLCIVGALIAYALWFRGLDRLSVLSVSFISLASPLSAAILGYVFLDQNLNSIQIFGAFAVILAVILAQPQSKSLLPNFLQRNN